MVTMFVARTVRSHQPWESSQGEDDPNSNSRTANTSLNSKNKSSRSMSIIHGAALGVVLTVDMHSSENLKCNVFEMSNRVNCRMRGFTAIRSQYYQKRLPSCGFFDTT